MDNKQKNAFNQARITIFITIFFLAMISVVHLSLYLRIENAKERLKKRMTILEVITKKKKIFFSLHNFKFEIFYLQ